MFESLQENIRSVIAKFGRQGRLTPEIIHDSLREIRRILLSADVNYRATKELISRIEKKALSQEVLETLTPEQTMIKIVRDELIDLLGGETKEPEYDTFEKPVKIILSGLQGSGKTTAAAKLGKYLKSALKFERVAVVACDTVRPAAVLQLRTLAEEAGLEFIGSHEDALMNAREALEKQELHDVLIFDTQGRLHIDTEMLDELKKMNDLITPQVSFLVIDSMFGQEALNVADSFASVLNLTGIILTKLDGDSRGGAALSAAYVTGVPVVYASTGEKIDDFMIFNPERMVSRILGMGDVLSIIEKAEKELDAKKAEEAGKKLLEGKFTLVDYLEQLRELKKLGGLDSIIEQLPYEIRKNIGIVDESILKRTEAIILSMTPEERMNPEIINGKRKERIAKGSGTKVQDVNQLLKSFYEMKKMFKNANKVKKRKFGFKFPF